MEGIGHGGPRNAALYAIAAVRTRVCGSTTGAAAAERETEELGAHKRFVSYMHSL